MQKAVFLLILLFNPSLILISQDSTGKLYDQNVNKEKLAQVTNLSLKDSTKATGIIQDCINNATRGNDRQMLAEAYYARADWMIRMNHQDEALLSANQALINALEIGREVLVSQVYELLSRIFIVKDLKYESLEYLYKGFRIAGELKDSLKLKWYLITISEIEQELGNITNAMGMTLKSIDYFTSSNDLKNLSKSHLILGLVQSDLGNYPEAQANIIKAQTYYHSTNDSLMLGITLSSLGKLQLQSKKYEEAITSANKASDILRDINKKYYLRNQSFISEINYSLSKLETASSIINQTIQQQILIDDRSGLSSSYLLLGNILYRKGEYEKSTQSFFRCVEKSKEIGLFKNISLAYKGLSEVSAYASQFQDAYRYLNLYTSISDSLYNLQKVSQANRLVNDAELSKKEKEIVKQEAQISLNAQRMKNERMKQLFLILVILIFMGIIILFYRDYKRKKILHYDLETQKKVAEEQKHIAEKRSRDILDSLNYARRIQQAILRASIKLEEFFPNSFILFIPKDIVSGDFYWVTKKDRNILFAVADCTGHGAPGAFMSIIGTHGLNRVVNEQNIVYPGEILNSLNVFFQSSFEQREGSEIFDGMDIGICSYDPVQQELNYSGANIPLHILRENSKPQPTAHITYKDDKRTLYQVIPNKQSIGYSFDEEAFKTHSIKLLAGDIIYIFTDGFSDQIGGADGKKFRIQELRKLLCTNAGDVMLNQKSILEKIYKDWKGSYIQVDDVSIMGIKIS